MKGFMSNPERSLDLNVVSQFRNLLVGTIAEQIYWPKLIVLVPDNNIITYYKHTKAGAEHGYGKLLNWIMQEHNQIVQTYKELLPDKAKKP